jgi:hypothetical protein
MTHATQMLETTPQQPLFDREALARCIDACFDCAQACRACADACLGEETVRELARCIALNEVCAISAPRRVPRSRARSQAISSCCIRCSRRARRRARVVATSANATPTCTSIAASAPKLVGTASSAAASCWEKPDASIWAVAMGARSEGC